MPPLLQSHPEDSVHSESLISHALGDYLDALGRYRSTRKLKKSLFYKSLEPEITRLLNSVEYGFYAADLPYEKKPFYRAVAWNVERGLNFEGILHMMRNHPEISRADLFYLTETDVGMARTQNRNVARKLASALGLNYFFAPGYLNLCKGNSVEGHYEGDNTTALHGNAFLSRFPMENLRVIPLGNCKDKMKGKEKRIGCQKTLVADVKFPFQTLTALTVHLDAHSSQSQRAAQMRSTLEVLAGNPYPVLMAGDWNTNCYNSRHGLFAFFGFWNKVFRGVDDVIENHYPYPDRTYDKRLFRVLKDCHFDYPAFNEVGVGTLHYRVEDMRSNHLIQEVVPAWCRRIMEETLRRHGGKVSLKLDWFAGRGLTAGDPSMGAAPPKVIPGLRYGGKMISDHDPILVDVDIYKC